MDGRDEGYKVGMKMRHIRGQRGHNQCELWHVLKEFVFLIFIKEFIFLFFFKENYFDQPKIKKLKTFLSYRSSSMIETSLLK